MNVEKKARRSSQPLVVDTVRDAHELARFDRFVVRGPADRDCWLYVGAIGDDGYGRFWMHRSGVKRVVRAQRYALALAEGSLDPDVVAAHACDNPLCVRVHADHVGVGTQSQNLAEMGSKGRGGGRTPIGLGWGPDRALRTQRSRALRAAVRNGWDADAVAEALTRWAPNQGVLF